jgi:hypothetical protein
VERGCSARTGTRGRKRRALARRDGRLKTVLCRYGQACPRQREDCWFAHGVANLACPSEMGMNMDEKRDCPGNVKADHIVSGLLLSDVFVVWVS